MNNMYQKCKEDKKFVPSEVKEANKEAKKDKLEIYMSRT